jgi:hypothetical protein
VGGKQLRPPKIVESAPRSGVGVEKQCHHPAPTTVGVVALVIATRHREEHISWQVLGVGHSFFQPQLKVTKQSQCNDDDDADCNSNDDENNNMVTMTHNDNETTTTRTTQWRWQNNVTQQSTMERKTSLSVKSCQNQWWLQNNNNNDKTTTMTKQQHDNNNKCRNLAGKLVARCPPRVPRAVWMPSSQDMPFGPSILVLNFWLLHIDVDDCLILFILCCCRNGLVILDGINNDNNNTRTLTTNNTTQQSTTKCDDFSKQQ